MHLSYRANGLQVLFLRHREIEDRQIGLLFRHRRYFVAGASLADRTAMVTSGELRRLPTFNTNGTVSPTGAFAGTRKFTCIELPLPV